MGITRRLFLLFVGRFIPDKGVHLLIKAFEKVDTNKKLVLVGGSPNPSAYEEEIHKTIDNRIVFAGYVYGNDTNILMKNAYAYVQPSLIEGLSPVILTVMGLGTPTDSV
ncbi:MAG: glycosyltransferase [Bacteroidales bacterium]|nr:glycosyltransferase [Bacteroidales bacterium]